MSRSRPRSIATVHARARPSATSGPAPKRVAVLEEQGLAGRAHVAVLRQVGQPQPDHGLVQHRPDLIDLGVDAAVVPGDGGRRVR